MALSGGSWEKGGPGRKRRVVKGPGCAKLQVFSSPVTAMDKLGGGFDRRLFRYSISQSPAES